MRFHGFNKFEDYICFNFSNAENDKIIKTKANLNSFAPFSLRLCPNLTKQISFVNNFVQWLYIGIFNFDSKPDDNDLMLVNKFGVEFNLTYFVRTIEEAAHRLDENEKKYELLTRKGQKGEFEKMTPM